MHHENVQMRFYFVPTVPFKSSVYMAVCVFVVVIENVSFDEMHGLVIVCDSDFCIPNTHLLKLQLKFEFHTNTDTLTIQYVYVY